MRVHVCMRVFVCVACVLTGIPVSVDVPVYRPQTHFVYLVFVPTNTDRVGTARGCSLNRTASKEPHTEPYGVALVSRIDKIIGLFCKRAL